MSEPKLIGQRHALHASAQSVEPPKPVRDRDFDELAEMYKPKGSCATGCGHEATFLWFMRVGSQRFQFRCHCCMAKGRLERALEYQKRIPKLERELAEAQSECGSTGSGADR